jgi:hypothetical protein
MRTSRTVNGRGRLGQSTSRTKKFFTESVENPVEKIGETRIALQQSEEISRLHHRGAVHSRVNKPTDYTVTTS